MRIRGVGDGPLPDIQFRRTKGEAVEVSSQTNDGAVEKILTNDPPFYWNFYWKSGCQ